MAINLFEVPPETTFLVNKVLIEEHRPSTSVIKRNQGPRPALLGLIAFQLLTMTACAKASRPTVLAQPTLPAPLSQPSETPKPILPTATISRPLESPTAGITLFPRPVEPSATPEPSDQEIFDQLIAPLVKDALARRQEKARTDPQYLKRINEVLNETRVNFLLFGYGETHEPPVTEKAIIGSHTILSYNLKTRQADIISLTHDTRAPEIERFLAKNKGQSKILPQRIDQAYMVGGFPLMGQTLEDATGLAMDFQIAFRDKAIADFVDTVTDGLVIDIPETFSVQPFYLDGVKYPEATFPKGLQKLTGRQVIQYIKTVPVSEAYYGKSLEHNKRKELIFLALTDWISQNLKTRDFWLKGSAFAGAQMVQGQIGYDFDAFRLLITNLREFASASQRLSGAKKGVMPTINKTIYIVDPCCGEGGVRWVDPNSDDPFIKKDCVNEVYPPNFAIQVPLNANANGDLVTEYWQSTRDLTRLWLMVK